MLQYASGDAMDTTEAPTLFPGPLTSVRDYVTEQVGAARTV
jgi:hypothetical protein